MSLISGANFVAPLRSKAQIVGIFALAALVAVLRLSSSNTSGNDGAVSSSSGYKSGAASGALENDVDSYLASRRKARSRDGDDSGVGDVTVDKLFAGGPSESSGRREKPQATEERSGEPEKLNDIARSLGLE